MTAATQSTTTDGADPSASRLPGPAKRARGDVLFFALRSKEVPYLSIDPDRAGFGSHLRSDHRQYGPVRAARVSRSSRRAAIPEASLERTTSATTSSPSSPTDCVRRSSSVSLGGGLGALIGWWSVLSADISEAGSTKSWPCSRTSCSSSRSGRSARHRVLPAVGAPRRALRSHLHRTHLVALGRESHSSPLSFARSTKSRDRTKTSGLEWLSRPRATR